MAVSPCIRQGLCAVALFAVCVSAQAADHFAFDIAPGNFDEHCVKIEAGQVLSYRFTAVARVDFNIHHHRGGQVLYPVKHDSVADAKGEFRAPSSDDYCLMWTNRGRRAVRIEGDIRR